MEMTLRDRVKRRRITHAFSLLLLGARIRISDARFWSLCWKIVPTLYSFVLYTTLVRLRYEPDASKSKKKPSLLPAESSPRNSL